MKVTVWTKWSNNGLSASDQPKCIFVGETDILPRVGEHICVRDGFCAHAVQDVIINLVDHEAEIKVNYADTENLYGPCLFHTRKKS